MTDFEEQVGAAGAIATLVAAGVAVLLAVAPPSAAQLSAADPLVQLAASRLGLWGIPVVSVLPAIGWWSLRPPARAARRRAARQAALALAAVALAVPLLRFAVGPALPAFIPPEESALPGTTLGLCAALLEEGVFRLVVLAVPYAAWVRSTGHRRTAAVTCIVLSAAVLALAHQLGPGAGEFHARYVVARFVVLGCFMGALFVWVGPAFLVAGHCAAHVAIPLFFPGPAS